MTPAAKVLTDKFVCELCYHYRPRLPRAFGVRFANRSWACDFCFAAYCAELVAGERRGNAA